MLSGIGKPCKDSCENTSLNCHAALPDVHDFREMVGIIAPVKKENVPQSSTDESCNPAVNADIGNMLFVAPAVLLGKEITNAGCQQDTDRKNQSVCPDGKVPNEKDILMHDVPLFV